MKCPNCGFNFSEGCRCPDCGVDVYVFRKARNASIRLYNEALTLAGETDLSGAAANLEQSLLFDKNNIQGEKSSRSDLLRNGAHRGCPQTLDYQLLPSARRKCCRRLYGVFAEKRQRNGKMQ